MPILTKEEMLSILNGELKLTSEKRKQIIDHAISYEGEGIRDRLESSEDGDLIAEYQGILVHNQR